MALPDVVGNIASLLICSSIQDITYSTYCVEEHLIACFILTPSAHLYSKPGGKPSPAPSCGKSPSEMIPHIKLTSLKKSTAAQTNKKHVREMAAILLLAASHSLRSSPGGNCTTALIFPLLKREGFTHVNLIRKIYVPLTNLPKVFFVYS